MVRQVVCKMMYPLSIIADLPSRSLPYKLQLHIANYTHPETLDQTTMQQCQPSHLTGQSTQQA